MFRISSKDVLLLLVLSVTLHTAETGAMTAHHNLWVRLFPSEGRLTGTDNIVISTEEETSILSLFLSEKASVTEVTLNSRNPDFSFQYGWLSIPLSSHDRSGRIRVEIRYECIFQDPTPVLPLNTDNPGYGVTGTISKDGSFLMAGAGWYPDISSRHSTYTIRVEAPAGILAVTAGKPLGHETANGTTLSEWEVTQPIEGLSLSAGQYEVREKAVGKIKAMTYLFPESAYLAKDSLDATARYVALYEDLFGPYPFDKFAVVENFFPTGYGFPSYTLLGSIILHLPFIIDTSLGHEIAHSWWGNGVYVDVSGGNWSEGLTTYVAEYLYRERSSSDEAREYRLQLLRNYATLVRPEDDFPLSSFRSRYNPVTKTIGYDKGTMVFHMVRRLLGDDAFWGALRDVYRNKLFRKAAWDDLQLAFEHSGKRSLQVFFDQWVSRTGAPEVSLQAVTSERSGDTWRVRGRIVQKRPYYHLNVALSLETRKKTLKKSLELAGEERSFEIICDAPPVRLAVDPEFDIFRRLHPSEIPPSVNSIKGSASLLIVVSEGSSSRLLGALEMLTVSLGLENFKMVPEKEVTRKDLAENDILLLGLPRRKDLLSKIPEQISVTKEAFTLNGKKYDHPSDTLFGVFRHPFAGNQVLALFLPLSDDYAQAVARKITHYGKYGYLVFNQGENRDKGIWPILESPLIYRWNKEE
jgi:hypothetical protein